MEKKSKIEWLRKSIVNQENNIERLYDALDVIVEFDKTDNVMKLKQSIREEIAKIEERIDNMNEEQLDLINDEMERKDNSK